VKTTNLLIPTILSLTVIVTTANTAVGNEIFHKVAQAQQLSQPVLPPGAEVKTATKSSIALRAYNTI
jgi:hypothetical protein